MADKKTILSTQPYKGTRDFYPQDMRVRTWIFDRIRKTLLSHGYEEYDGPMLEPFELYASKSSEEIVNEQLYWMIDRGERKLAVRPEMTPTLARMVAGKQNELPKPIRWFSIPNLWRYERPQRGRLREHWQLNVDVFGGSAVGEDTEILFLISELMGAFGAAADGKKYEIRLNHRGLINQLFNEVLKLSAEQIPVVGHLLDGAPKMPRDVYKQKLSEAGLNSEQVEIMNGLLEPDAAARLGNILGDSPHYQHLNSLLEKMKQLGVGAAYKFDPSIMRGFLYYTGVVMELFDLHPENNRALFGGGRYDDLVGMFGGATLPGVGFGMGDVTFTNFLQSHGLLPDFKTRNGVYISYMDDGLVLEAQKLAKQVRDALALKGIDVPVMAGLSAEKPKKAIPNAEKLGCRFAVIVGGDDVAKGAFPTKDLSNGQQEAGNPEQMAQFIAKGLKG